MKCGSNLDSDRLGPARETETAAGTQAKDSGGEGGPSGCVVGSSVCQTKRSYVTSL